MRRLMAAVAGLAVAGGLTAAPVKDADPILVGTRWAGRLTQKGTFAGGGEGPPSFATTLTVTKRSGAEFEAELREETAALGITYVVKGEVTRAADGKGYAVTFRSVDAKDISGTSAILGVPYTGTVAGRALKGTWKYRQPAQTAEVAGEFALELSR